MPLMAPAFVMVAAVVVSYTLLATDVPLSVSGLGVIAAVTPVG
jgi:hypothetical protein